MKSKEKISMIERLIESSNLTIYYKDCLNEVLKDLERLEAIDNANSSEALMCLKKNSELFDKIAKENPTTYKNETFAEAFLFKTNTIKIEQALLKAQEQDKILDILIKTLNI